MVEGSRVESAGEGIEEVSKFDKNKDMDYYYGKSDLQFFLFGGQYGSQTKSDNYD